MALRLLSVPSTFLRERNRPTLTLQKPYKTSFSLSSLSFSTSSGSPFSNIPSRRRSSLVFQISSSTQQQSSSSITTVETPITEPENEPRKRLIAQNVPWTCTTEDIRNLFEKQGTVTDVELSMHNKTRNRGLAFITMGSEEEALAALTNLDSYEFEGRPIRVAYAKTQKKKSSPVPTVREPQHNVFVANLSWNVKSADLREFFGSTNGNVVAAEVIYETNPRRSTGYGFVSFSSKEEAEAAISAFKGKTLMGRPIRLGRSRKSLKKKSKEYGTQLEETTAETNGDGGLSDEADEMSGAIVGAV